MSPLAWKKLKQNNHPTQARACELTLPPQPIDKVERCVAAASPGVPDFVALTQLTKQVKNSRHVLC